MGFCLFNTVAIAAHEAIEARGVERVLVFDWDVHHGNGTNDLFHDSDQVLFVTAGKGIIATETEKEIIGVGDVVHIPAEERHWHGATPDSAFSHIALTAKGSTTTQVEE